MTADVMDVLDEIFGSGQQFWLEKDGVSLSDNPFYLQNDILYDRYDHVRDDILGMVVRGVVKIVTGGKDQIPLGGKYLFVNEQGQIKSKRCRNDLVDILNVTIGNMFLSEPSDKEKSRVMSTLAGLSKMATCLFPYGIHGDINEVRDKFLSIATPPDDREMAGVLRESFRQLGPANKSLIELSGLLPADGEKVVPRIGAGKGKRA